MSAVRPCPVCGSLEQEERYPRSAKRAQDNVEAEALRPSSDAFGRPAGNIVRCSTCGHAFVEDPPGVEEYENTEDPVTIREEPGRVATAQRDLVDIERYVEPGRILDVGCWTGAFLLAARDRGWDPVGIEPSKWATEQANAQGLDVRTATLETHDLGDMRFRLIVLMDVIEHVTDPGDALRTIAGLLEEGGSVFMATPDAGSRMARTMGRRWWSVMPMHLQYFTRNSLSSLLERNGFNVRFVRTHPKSFSARYYAERLGGYSSIVERAAVGTLKVVRRVDKLVSPDFRDRMAILATRSR